MKVTIIVTYDTKTSTVEVQNEDNLTQLEVIGILEVGKLVAYSEGFEEEDD